ncbi:MAG TPA: response regulator transcription factor [Spirochaetota bacterium]|jgi:DNA-binding NarL/FixJ family response regulator|nr:MAG: putative transcriptional regulatory protein pdtaR [Spirochaetes bacterium ADurb.Bin218]HOQ10834.1 response regulator transcription factor [Spirochaetota bacterium]HPP95305.1 response regulator transcription factor [Spirochaetota bacterium]HRS63433.1 response regulator transcription factor [Spirochaetota bacterium]
MDILVNDMKILIVDDSAMIRERLIRMLSSFDGVSVLGLTGDEDWEIIGGLNPDFVVLDIKLNKRSGIDILKNLKRRCPCVPVAMLTNYYDNYYIEKCREFGADYFFDKSHDFDELANTIIDYKKMN